MRGSDEDQSEEDGTLPPLENQAHYTETDVTLPSSLNGTLGSRETEPTVGVAVGDRCREGARVQLLSLSSPITSSGIGQVYQEMMLIYDQLKSERMSQQAWERELQERESRLLLQEETLGNIQRLEQEVHARVLDVQQRHQQEVKQLQRLLRERTKENRRLRGSFDTIKELNDTTRTQARERQVEKDHRTLAEVSEQNRKLESQARKLQARLENLQRKFEFSTAQRGHHKPCWKAADARLSEPAAMSAKRSKGSASPAPLRLLSLLLDWVLDGQTFSPVEVQGLVSGQGLPPAVLLQERCSKVLPQLADQLHQSSGSEPSLVLPLLRFTYWTLRQMDSNTQAVALSSTLRRIGEEVSRPPAAPQLSAPDPHQPEGGPGALSKPRGTPTTAPLYRSPCSHTRLLSALIVLRTVTQADVLAQVLDSLHSGLVCVETRGLFLHYGGVCVLLTLLRAGRGGLHTPIDILLQLTAQSRFLGPFLEACSCEEFFRLASQLLKRPRLELPWLEKLSILLQKLSNVRKNRRFFEVSSLHLQIQELQRTTDPTHTFLCLNLGSILINLK
ncbi:coiled-coil domain-containing protein 138 [Aplochiton taeniatus]